MAEGGKGSGSGSDSDSKNGTETNVAVSVNKEYDGDVQLLLKIRGLKPRTGFFNKFFSKFSKHDDPSYLCANAEFTTWNLTDTSLAMTVRVQTEKRRKAKDRKPPAQGPDTAAAAAAPSSDDLHTETFNFRIRRFPSDIQSESAKLEIVQPSGGRYSFIVLTLRKADNSVSWKDFQVTHGTIDASSI